MTLSLTFTSPSYLTSPAPQADPRRGDALRYLKTAQAERMDPVAMRAGCRAIVTGLIPVFGGVREIAEHGATEGVVRVVGAVVHDGQAADVRAAVGFARLDQDGDGLFCGLKLLGDREVGHGSAPCRENPYHQAESGPTASREDVQ